MDVSCQAMFKSTDEHAKTVTNQLVAGGYWPALAARFLAEGRYSRAMEICMANLSQERGLVAGRLIYARVLFHAGQTEAAAEQFYYVLSRNPDNLVALKYLGDLKFADGDEIGALAHYRRILEIDPECHGLKSDLARIDREKTRTITLTRSTEKVASHRTGHPLRRIPFFTETIGDLYMEQGYPRLAAEVYRSLGEKRQNSRLTEKLAKAEQSIKHKEH